MTAALTDGVPYLYCRLISLEGQRLSLPLLLCQRRRQDEEDRGAGVCDELVVQGDVVGGRRRGDGVPPDEIERREDLLV